MRTDAIRNLDAVREAERQRAAHGAPADGAAFRRALEQATQRQTERQATPTSAVAFSKHALERLEQRDIRLTDALLGRLEGAVQRAAGKGSQTTLVMIDELAFVVGVPGRTVVTVADQQALKERVFTNIDSLVIG